MIKVILSCMHCGTELCVSPEGHWASRCWDYGGKSRTMLKIPVDDGMMTKTDRFTDYVCALCREEKGVKTW